MPRLHNTTFIIKFKTGLRKNLEKAVNYFLTGEPVYCRDTGQLFIGGENYHPRPVQTLDMAVTHEDGVVVHDGDIVFHY